MEISHGQQLCFPCSQPSFGGTRLTFWAVPIAAGIIGDVLMRAVGASRDMAAKRRCAAALNGIHDFKLGQVDVSRVCCAPSSTMGAENVCDLQL